MSITITALGSTNRSFWIWSGRWHQWEDTAWVLQPFLIGWKGLFGSRGRWWCSRELGIQVGNRLLATSSSRDSWDCSAAEADGLLDTREETAQVEPEKESVLLVSEVWDNMKKWLMSKGARQILIVKKTMIFLFPCCRGGKNSYRSFGEKETDKTEGGRCYLFDPECDPHDRRWINIL